MPVTKDSTIAHYHITAKLGDGGMGEVWRARDTKLDRDVAIKVLPEAFASDPDRLARFDREAKLLARLNHPNIGQIYGLEQTDDVKAIVLELVQGPTLVDRIAQGPISVNQALPIARQIAEALEAAHEQSIVHRDLKPANIKLTNDDRVKVLDFGLAKALQPATEAGGEDSSQAETLFAGAETHIGVILGTPGYMAPEQARGNAVDHRADIWAFGCVLYEMLTGSRPYQGMVLSQPGAPAISPQPDLSKLPRSLSPSLVAFLQRSLEVDSRRRVQAIGDMRLALEGAFEMGRPDATAPRALWRRPALPWSAAAMAVLLAVAAIGFDRGSEDEPTTPPRPQRRFAIDSEEGTSLPQGLGSAIAISPDGETLVYAADTAGGRMLYRRSFADFDATPIRGTEGALMPFFSPDGEWVAFGDETLTEIRKVPLSGGEPFAVCSQCIDGHWGDEGSIVFGRNGAVYRVPETGGEPEVLVRPMPERGIVAVGRPKLLPGSNGLLVDINPFECGGIGVVSLRDKTLTVVTEHGTDPLYSPTGHILFARERALHAVPFDLERLEIKGRESAVLSGVRVENGGSVQATLSPSGVLVYVPAGASIGAQLVWVDRASGQIEQVLEEGQFFRTPRLSPDGQRIALQIIAEGRCDLWLREAGTLRPLTRTGKASSPIWTPDGRSVTLSSRTADSSVIQSILIEGDGEVRTLLASSLPLVPETWSPDGGELIFREVSSSPDLFVTDTSRPGSRREYAAEAFAEYSAKLSPSGTWIAYVSDQAGSNDVYVRPFPGPGRERRVSRGGGEHPLWGRDDSELVFISSDGGDVVAASLRLDRSEVVERERVLFDAAPYWLPPDHAHYDVHPDGRRFLMLNQRDPSATRSTLRVVENWFLDLQQLTKTE